MLKKPSYNNSNEDTKYVTVDYCQTAEKITNSVFKNAPLTIAFKTKNKLSQVLKPRNNAPRNMNEKQGVYKINCGECDAYYTGCPKSKVPNSGKWLSGSK
jgi:hypothetical protein